MTDRRRLSRHHAPALEQRAEGKPPVITGYAAVFYDPADAGTEYRLWDDTVERILPGCFDRAMREDDCRALFNHQDGAVLGRTTSGTLKLSVDKKGLRYEIEPPDTQTARELVELIRRGDVTGSSFSFLPKSTTWSRVDDTYVIERKDVTLFDVGPVTFPAYASTEAGVRAAHADQADAVRRERKEWEQSNAPDRRAAALARARAVAVAMAE